MRYQVFCNPIGLGIDTAKSEPASQTLELDAEQIAAGCKLDLRFVLFQKVSSLALFFPENHEGTRALRNISVLSSYVSSAGGERTVVERLAVYGLIVPQVPFRCAARRTPPRAAEACVLVQEGAAWAKDKDAQEATAKGDWLGKKSLG